MSRGVRIGVVLVMLIGWVVSAEIFEGTPYLLAGLGDLAAYPAAQSVEQVPTVDRIYAVVLPETDRVVLLRPMLEMEFGSFQVQSIAREAIDAQMLAAVMVLPVIAPEDVLAFSVELVELLQRTVNQISGFPVFPKVLIPPG